jgi:hypothetical protein
VSGVPGRLRTIGIPTATSGVVQIFPKDRLDGTRGDPSEEKDLKKSLIHAKSLRDAFPRASYFSLISAVNIGFEQLTPGDWIRRLQPRDCWERPASRRAAWAACVMCCARSRRSVTMT